MSRRPNLSLPLLLAVAALLPAAGLALPEDRQQPIHLESVSAEYDQKSGVSTYQGNVVVSQGSMRLTADLAKVFLNPNGDVQRMEATGNPATFRYQPSRDKPEINGVGQKVEYETASAKVVVTGGARFTQGQDVFTGDRVEYDINLDKVKASSDSGNRVRFTIQPKSEPKSGKGGG
ncbi:MAG TPA: lipopolysaccharide transport periplasmic protein LptA [Candidatus Competibacteraceae bacterium]|nr:lipopolysaccharide transport periplasmic protein LptA [Candidatus Competibacteraceae bacterium]